MRILVTGGTGFIGRRLVMALIKEGHAIKVIARDPKKAKPVEKTGAQVVIGNLGDKKFLRKELVGVETIYHLAAIPGQIWGVPWEEYKKVNIDYTQNLLEACLASKVRRFIFCSSLQATDPSTFYGRSKLEAEVAVRRSGLENVIVRPGIVYGPGGKGAILQACRLVKRGFFPLIGGGKARLVVIFVEDLVGLLLRSSTPEAKNKTLLGIGEEIAFRDLVETVAKELDKPCWMIALPAALFKIIAIPFGAISEVTGIPPLTTREQIDFINRDWHFKISEGEQRFWQPKIKFKEGVKKTIRWYQENGYL